MKAFRIDGPNSFSFGDAPLPKLQEGQVLLRVERIGYCGSDLNTFRAANPLVSYPRVPGHEVGAVVEKVTSGVPGTIRVGMEVTILPYTACGKCSSCRASRPNACRDNKTLGVQQEGALTEHLAVPWQNIVHSPKLTLAELALVEPLAVGFHGVERAEVKSNETVLVLGAGMIGLGAIAAAGMVRSARVIAVDIDDAKLALAREAGAALTINSRTENLQDRIAEFTAGEGVSVAIEAVGIPETFIAAVEAAAYCGRVVFIGYSKHAVSFDTKQFLLKELDIRGSRNANRGNFQEVITMLESGRYPVSQTITRTVPFGEAGEALREWSANPAGVTKIHVTLFTKNRKVRA